MQENAFFYWQFTVFEQKKKKTVQHLIIYNPIINQLQIVLISS